MVSGFDPLKRKDWFMDLGAISRIGLGAARTAGDILKAHFGKALIVKKKGVTDLVTQADLASEKAIVEIIGNAFPDHMILAEESGEAGKGSASGVWIIDPLDGTTNYAHGLPIFAVSIAYALEGETLLGIVLNPVSGELFMAKKGEGATKNSRLIYVSTTNVLRDSLLVTGFPYNLSSMKEELMERFQDCLEASQGVRRLGSAALDLCYVACGRFEGFWEQNLQPWDTATGAFILEQAGGRVTDFSKKEFTPFKHEILATNGKIHDALASVLTK